MGFLSLKKGKAHYPSGVIPLSRAREINPLFAKAANFVETIYGKPLRKETTIRFIARKRLLFGGSSDGINVAVPPRNKRIIVHELTHCQDSTNTDNFGGSAPQVVQGAAVFSFLARHILFLEGRAVFLSAAYAGKIRRLNSNFAVMFGGAMMFIENNLHLVRKTLQAAFPHGLPHAHIMPQIPMFPPIVEDLLAASIFALGAAYWLFYNGLCKIAKEVGDPITAFNITTKKFPTWHGIFFPKKFYKQEIEQAKYRI